jgi:hypothetical protein
MTTWGSEPPSYQWTPPAYTQPTEPAPPRRRRALPIALLVMLLIAGAAGAGYWFYVRDDDSQHFPSKWDPRVADLVAFVEKQRGLDFEHPVEIHFLDDAEWKKEMSTDPSDLTKQDRADLDNAVGFLRALGLVEGKVDLFAGANELQVSDVLALYDFNDKEIRVHEAPTEKLSLATRGTLVHELTHVLQDQHFDLNKQTEAAGDDSFAFDAIVEGDATNSEDAWTAKLSATDKAEYDKEYAEQGPDDQATKDVPAVLETFFGAPYALGPWFAQVLHDKSERALDDAFKKPPKSDEAAFAPDSYLRGDKPDLVDHPSAPEGAKELDDGTFGVLAWYVMLSERIDPHIALAAALGWGGDHYVEYKQHGKTCLRIEYKGERANDTKTMKSAVEAWIASLPSAFATVKNDGDAIRLESCDPGEDVSLETGKSQDALAFPIIRTQIFASVYGEGAPVKYATCYADRVVAESSLDELQTDELTPELQSRIQTAAKDCF